MESVKEVIIKAVDAVYGVTVDPEVSYPEPQFGDFTSNIAFMLASQLKQSPQKIAENISHSLYLPHVIQAVEVLNGFLNFTMAPSYYEDKLKELLKVSPHKKLNKSVVIEFTDPNPFKEFHVGHLYSSTVGEAISRLWEFKGYTVHRVSYHGDTGIHVATAIWGMQQALKDIDINALPREARAKFLGKAYAAGAKAFKEDPEFAETIKQLNQAIYMRTNPEVNTLYDLGRKWSLDYFTEIFERLGVKYGQAYFESETGKKGLEVVIRGLKKGIFEESEGAIIFRGEQYGLHTRVFINSQGLPVYEAKDIGLAYLKESDYHPDISIIITGNEINDYFKVVLTALERLEPAICRKTKHLSHGMVRLTSGKMSSRTGDVVTALDLIEETRLQISKITPDTDVVEIAALGAIKYAFLKSNIGKDIVFDLKEAININGNSGPYLQYTYARTQSVLKKSSKKPIVKISTLTEEELELIRGVIKFNEVITKAALELAPHQLVTYLFEIAQQFNKFYEKQRIIGEPTEEFRLGLVAATSQVLHAGLNVLGIVTPERM